MAILWVVLAFLHVECMMLSATKIYVVNQSKSTVCAKYWVPKNNIGGKCKELEPGSRWGIVASSKWKAATIWAVVGSCAGQTCNTGPGSMVTQFEFTLGGSSNNDFYDVSMQAGFNLGIVVQPTNSKCLPEACTSPIHCQDLISNQPVKTCPYGTTDYIVSLQSY